ncbi:MAG TPA: ABC transporter ATP-binding protein, partial [Methanobacteriaceae archaeon]|nr:ABC transporter ATP-binding protein [Methanobacteriaceae archaeon]
MSWDPLKYNKSIMGRYTSSLISYLPRDVVFSVFLMVLISFTEGVGLLVLIPLLQLVGLDVTGGSLGQFSNFVAGVFSFFKVKPTLVLVLIIYVVVIAISTLLSRWQTLRSSQIQYQFAAHLRKRLYNAITSSDWLFFSKKRSSDLAHALTSEVERVGIGTGQFLTLIASIMILVVYILFSLALAGILTGLIFLVGVTFLLVLRRWVGRSRRVGEDITVSNREMYS